MNTFTLIGNPNLHYTRQVKAYKLKQPKARTTVSSRSISTMGPKVWNNINPNMYQRQVKNTCTYKFTNLKSFMSKLRHTILDSY